MDLPTDYRKLSPSERRSVREEYIKRQDGVCSHCNEPLMAGPRHDVEAKQLNMRLFPKDFLRWPVHLHHSHKTGMTLGAVHAKCNGVLWQYHGE